MKGRAKSLPVKPTKGLICSVREEPNSVQPCQFRFLTNHYQPRAANPRKQPEKLGWESGVFSDALRNAFRDPRNSPEKSPEKSTGQRSFRVFWETHARREAILGKNSMLLIKSGIKPSSHYTGGILYFYGYTTVRFNPSQKRSVSKTLFKPEEFDNSSFAF